MGIALLFLLLAVICLWRNKHTDISYFQYANRTGSFISLVKQLPYTDTLITLAN